MNYPPNTVRTDAHILLDLVAALTAKVESLHAENVKLVGICNARQKEIAFLASENAKLEETVEFLNQRDLVEIGMKTDVKIPPHPQELSPWDIVEAQKAGIRTLREANDLLRAGNQALRDENLRQHQRCFHIGRINQYLDCPNLSGDPVGASENNDT